MTDAVTFVPLGAAGLRALTAGDLAEASRVTGFDLPEEYLEHTWLWELRLAQVEREPADEEWVAWIVARADDGTVIGRSGFHGRPDADGMVELSYSVIPEYQRRGYATAMLTHIVAAARESPDVRVLRASINPDNTASLATLAKFPFVHVGDQMDEIDGLELVFDLAVAD
ncbi:RimJ/RimL family protein N-acetyltransferase [Okibacterium sp. HSC-33S16]|uniref:GNAT family N-acetyltransferase n=1 Tax=Okibacterium sp. HSC-33S16 TaxID=2910965 RepID=UPI00209DFA3F|nr:GNAT family N-acetyltransferase [Okibacterium sp. HSC-33S16]MCP2032233.1 RimJ/RimL family protein N-acetyltransferase [Okibacterium sp. HSC-33S16]